MHSELFSWKLISEADVFPFSDNLSAAENAPRLEIINILISLSYQCVEGGIGNVVNLLAENFHVRVGDVNFDKSARAVENSTKQKFEEDEQTNRACHGEDKGREREGGWERRFEWSVSVKEQSGTKYTVGTCRLPDTETEERKWIDEDERNRTEAFRILIFLNL